MRFFFRKSLVCIYIAIISFVIAGCTNNETKKADGWIPLLRDDNMVGTPFFRIMAGTAIRRVFFH